MEYNFKDKYLFVNDSIKIDIDLTKFKDKLETAQSDLVNQIIADTQDYVPFLQGTLSESAKPNEDNTKIIYNTPYARFQYMGKLMLDSRGSSWAKKNTKKHVVNKDLTYSREHHSQAGAKWYERSKENNLNNWIEVVKRAVSK